MEDHSSDEIATDAPKPPDVADSSAVNEPVLSALLDRLIPAVDNLPGAGEMGLVPEVVRLSGQQERFSALFSRAMASFVSRNPTFESLTGEEQDEAIRSFEAESPRQFSVILKISYIAYYKDPTVHERIGWDGNNPQPDGNEMIPWDESVLENIRKREPFWRRV